MIAVPLSVFCEFSPREHNILVLKTKISFHVPADKIGGGRGRRLIIFTIILPFPCNLKPNQYLPTKKSAT